MALWGNNDNVGSAGSVSLDYSNRVVSGWGTFTGALVSGVTSFAQAGFAKTGDIISFGQHGSGTYFGEAVIASIGSSMRLTIASTEALNGSAIAGVEYQISEKPSYTVGGGKVLLNVIRPFDGKVAYFDDQYYSVGAIKVTNPGSGYNSPPTITISSPTSTPEWGVHATAVATIFQGRVS